uniref:MIF4G domain-containing protein n=1 Tax=Anopheles epiroticus TaxID=199890 RepID=A0A182P0M6_9DIPT
MAQQDKYPEMRLPKAISLSANAKVFVPKARTVAPQQQPQQQQQQQQPPYHHQGFQVMPHLHQRLVMPQGGVEPGGGSDGGGGYEYGAMAQQHLAGNSNGPMMPNGSDMRKISPLQSRLSNMQIVDGGDSGKEHYHHQQQQQQQHQHHVTHHQQQYGGNHHHQDFMEGGQGGYNAGMVANWDSNLQEDLDQQISYRQTEALDYLTEVIAELFDNPGMFDELRKQLPSKLGELRQDHYVLSNTIEMIFEQSIKESNFRYMGARLCQLLDSTDKGPNLALRELLELKMADQNTQLQEFMQQEQVKVRGATLFLAELYMQLRQPQETFGKRISEYIISAIETLLNKEGPENMKCVCQCLKLCGFELEQDCPDKVDSIMKTIATRRTALPSSAEKIIDSVIELRKIAWGRGDEISSAPAAVPPPMPISSVTAMSHQPTGIVEFNDSPVFYGPDGQVLTEEENSFLETNVGKNGKQKTYTGYDDDDEYGLVDPDDDPDVQQAFEEFLQSNTQNRLQQQYRPDV